MQTQNSGSLQVRLVTLLVTGILVFSSSCAQPVEESLTREVKSRLINQTIVLLNDNYVFPETASRMEEFLRGQLSSGKYDYISDPDKFAERLTSDLYGISHDKHLRVYFNPDRNRPGRESDSKRPETSGTTNYGFADIRILEGNIGYIDLRGFHDAGGAGATAHRAMNKVSDTDILIFDLRKNGGGSPSMIQLLSSYLFTAEPVHLNTFYWRPSNSYSETWTLRNIPGKRRPERPVFVLTSSYTFSAAEEFSYNLKNLGRATLVGETTGGGAHPGGMMPVTDNFSVWVPRGRAINPVTGTNWEGTGVAPDIAVSAEEALKTAYRLALQKLAESREATAYDILLDKLARNEIDLPGE